MIARSSRGECRESARAKRERERLDEEREGLPGEGTKEAGLDSRNIRDDQGQTIKLR